MTKLFFILLFLTLTGTASSQTPDSLTTIPQKPKISFTFDDGSTNNMPGYKLEAWNQMLLNTLEKHQIKAALFVKGSSLTGERGRYVISSWDSADHKIGNHTYSHMYFNSKKVMLRQFENDFLRNDSIIKQYKNFYPYFRFPYLKEGDTEDKVFGFRTFLADQHYKNAHVTIDASDWYIDGRLVQRLKENPIADISGLKQFYIEHLYNRAMYYDSLSTELTERKISHTLLLHHNLAAALFLDDLIVYFKEKGWEIVDIDKAYEDEIYMSQPDIVPAGESLIWSLAKQSGNFEGELRYPAEDGEYEKVKMDLLGL